MAYDEDWAMETALYPWLDMDCGEEVNEIDCDVDEYDDEYDDDFDDEPDFADPGGRSALRAASKKNPRNRTCPTCQQPNRLTAADVARGYQCDSCADRDEMGGY